MKKKNDTLLSRIQIRGDVYFYTYDEEVRTWLRDNAYQEDMTAEKSL